MCAAAWIFGLQPVNFAPRWGTKRPGEASKEWLFSIDMFWTVLHSGSTKTCIASKDFKADKFSSEVWILGAGNNLEIWAETRERAPLELLQISSHEPSPVPSQGSWPWPPHSSCCCCKSSLLTLYFAWAQPEHIAPSLKALEYLVNTWSLFPQWRSRKWL